jgi:hypothetical protein
MKAAVLGFVLLAIPALGGVHDNSGNLTRSDLKFFFDSVKFDGTRWIYHLSPNTHGMLWRIQDGKSDTTAACEPGTDLIVARGAHLELKNGGTDLNVSPWGGQERAVLRIPAEPRLGAEAESREALVTSNSRGQLHLFYFED